MTAGPRATVVLLPTHTHRGGGGTVHAQGYGVFRFDSKYGANVDGYSPIWSPNEWSETGDEYSGGTLGLLVW